MTTLRKIVRVLLALALVAGGIWLLRFAARDLLRPVPPPSSPASAAETVSVPAPRAIDLSTAIPKRLWLTLGGLAPDTDEETLPLPLDQARAETAARLEARGWHPLADVLPLEQTLLLGLAEGALYATPERAIAQVSFAAAPNGGTRVRITRLGAEGAEPLDPQTAAQADGLTLLARSAARLRPERALPYWLAAPCLGHALTTRLVRRRGGTAFYLTALVAGEPPAQALARVTTAASGAGWRQAPAPIDALRAAGAPVVGALTLIYRNVACNVRATAGPRAGELTLVYRFTDDEVYVRPPRKDTP